MTMLAKQSEGLYARQLAFVCAFLLPVGKLLEAPSLLAKYAEGDLLLPAFLHFLLQGALLFLLLFALSKSELTLFERLQRLGKWAIPIYAIYAIFFIFYAILPLLDLEKFTYAAFSDTEPTFFNFAFFFLLSAFICTKSLKSVERCADLCLFLFPLPFLALLGMGLVETDFSHLLPWFGTPLESTMYALKYTTPHFFDVVLLLPLFLHYRHKKGDSVKIMSGYGVGAVFCLFFFAVFFGIYSSLAPKEHYAFSKIAQYFPALSVVGRVDLIFVYLISVVLLFFTSLPLQYTSELCTRIFPKVKRVYASILLNVGLFLFVLYTNKYYDRIYALICDKLPVVFWLVAYLLPLFIFFLPKTNKEKSKNGEVNHVKN